MVQHILVLCTGNSCRSIMAEAIVNHMGKGCIRAMSAGSRPVGYVHPQALDTLQRHYIPLGAPSSKSWNVFAGQSFDKVITVYDAAADENDRRFFNGLSESEQRQFLATIRQLLRMNGWKSAEHGHDGLN